MYTELSIGFYFKEDTPKKVIDIIEYMVSPEKRDEIEETEELGLPEHPLFHTERWQWMLNSAGSYYFRRKPSLVWLFDDIKKQWNLSFTTNIKNYDSEWQKFCHWIAPYVEEDEAPIGTYRYEEDELPTLVIADKGIIRFGNIVDLSSYPVNTAEIT